MTIRDILNTKGNRVITIVPHHTLYLALCTMVESKVGALIVQNAENEVIGIITERDIMREVYRDTDLRLARIEDVMTRDLVTGSPDHEVEYVMSAMTEGRFRHMPILEENELVGIVSIGDMVKSRLQHVEEEVTQYKDFVTLDWRAS
jgi:CBS domain-containing protein